MLWLVILLPTMTAKCAWMPFPVKEEWRAVERHRFREKSDILYILFASLLLFSTRSLWNSNLGMTNRVITFGIDLASFELQMCNIWLLRIEGQWRSKFEEVVGCRCRTRTAVGDAAKASYNKGPEVPTNEDIYFFETSRCEDVSKCSSRRENRSKPLILSLFLM